MSESVTPPSVVSFLAGIIAERVLGKETIPGEDVTVVSNADGRYGFLWQRPEGRFAVTVQQWDSLTATTLDAHPPV